ncbi:MAG: VOC family protein [Cytophagales bacterium]
MAFHVSDLERSKAFYTEFLGFHSVERPSFSFAGLWLRNISGLEIHLIEGKNPESSVDAGSRKNHIAFLVDDVYEWLPLINELGVEHIGPKKRPDDINQLFVKDPDGYWIEITEG